MIYIYTRDFCPFCRKVKAYVEENGIEVEWKNLGENPELKDELMELGGKTQVPFLFDSETDAQMYESDDIIAYLEGK